MIKYFKVTSRWFVNPFYYAAYREEDAREEAYSAFSVESQFEEITFEEIPLNSVIRTANLRFADSRKLALTRLAD